VETWASSLPVVVVRRKEDETKAKRREGDNTHTHNTPTHSLFDAKIDGYMKQLGPDFQTAWNAGENLDENSPDAKAMDDAINELQSKCAA